MKMAMKDSLVIGTTLKRKQKPMPKFRIEWTEEFWYALEVEGESREEVLDKFHKHEYDFDDADNLGAELQDSITVEEVE
jgi:hypothetical protein